MASMLFTRPSDGFTLDEVHSALVAMATKLNSERARLGITRFATVYVGPLLAYPRSEEVSFTVSYSDNDSDAPEAINSALVRLTEERKWYFFRDPYCV